VTLAIALCGCGRGAGRDACDEYVAAVRSGESPGFKRFPRGSGWDNDNVIDTYVDIIAYGGDNRVRAARNLSSGRGIQKWDPPPAGRELEFTLPARIAPILLATLREDSPRWQQFRDNVILALGGIDEPTPEVVAAVHGALNGEHRRPPRHALRAARRLGVHAADMTGDLERLLAVDRPAGLRLSAWDNDRAALAATLVWVSAAPRPDALDLLAEATRNGSEMVARNAVSYLEGLGPRAEPVVDALTAILHERDIGRPRVAKAIVAVSPDMFDEVLSVVVAQVASDDPVIASFGDAELKYLSQGHWGELGAAEPALISALESRPPADAAELSAQVRRLDTRNSRKAYNAYVRRRRLAERAADGAPAAGRGN
jgi:hypothetical protein